MAVGAAPAPSVWELDTGALRLSLTLSPEPYRGFSGEGAALAALAGDDVVDDADLVSALLSWDPTIEPDRLAEQAGIDAERVRGALAQLGTAGRVGYDVAEAAYFHRVMPYDAGRAERDNPRLVGARARSAAATEVYRVRQLPDGGLTCTCPWWAKHRGQRGPCRHALASRMLATERVEERV
ncbi:SWIM zinc finger family protein [Verrucosispora sioxanthis]|uniref:SWIM zinc finger family protein n=1 Tax=Verrucosispora sioxanthis TaxID=2499994 RepID=UPI0028150211|nr:SWIM zinc finger family protein [Verrucosispora sioxanthis]